MDTHIVSERVLYHLQFLSVYMHINFFHSLVRSIFHSTPACILHESFPPTHTFKNEGFQQHICIAICMKTFHTRIHIATYFSYEDTHILYCYYIPS